MNILLPMLSTKASEHLTSFRGEVESALPGRVAGMMLFGSRARGEAVQDSDYDVAVFVRGTADRKDIRDRVADAAYDHILEGVHISPIVLPDDYLEKADTTELAAEIKRDGIELP